MAQRKRIALIFKVDKAWMGGTYYVLNLIRALNTLPSEEKPKITLLCEKDSDYDFAVANSDYPLLKKHILSEGIAHKFIRRAINLLGRRFIGKNVMPIHHYRERVDIVYPILDPIYLNPKSTKLVWIPDLQEKFLPDLFNKENIKMRDDRIKQIIADGYDIVFSSHDAESHFRHFYPEGGSIHTYVLHFASKICPLDNDEAKQRVDSYAVPEKFFYCANQFWTHKNHMTLFKAIKHLKENGRDVVVYCSGATADYRNPEYFPSLQRYVVENGLEDNIKILGFIDRKDQIALMTRCHAIIQPSLFEGWNTGVEEAKSLNKYMILSDLEVHKEQVKNNVIFFRRNSPEDLACAIATVFDNLPQSVEYDYDEVIKEEGQTFMKIIEKLSRKH